jgi:hypothetical protein
MRQGQNGEESRVQRMKLQLFKFWPSTDLKLAWRAYIEHTQVMEDDNVGALMILLKILEMVYQQFARR